MIGKLNTKNRNERIVDTDSCTVCILRFMPSKHKVYNFPDVAHNTDLLGVKGCFKRSQPKTKESRTC